MILLAQATNLPTVPWQNFFAIIGSSAGALVGLQFVVIALIANSRGMADIQTINAFGTPTVVNFSEALIISAVMSAPWPTLRCVLVALVACGVGGFVYSLNVIRRARRQATYKPVAEDWVWYVTLPSVAYAASTLASFFLCARTQESLFVVGAVTLALLLIGIRNAWDTVTHVVITNATDATKPK